MFDMYGDSYENWLEMLAVVIILIPISSVGGICDVTQSQGCTCEKCVYVYGCTYVYMYIYICIYVHIHMYIHVYTSMYLYIHPQIYSNSYAHIYDVTQSQGCTCEKCAHFSHVSTLTIFLSTFTFFCPRVKPVEGGVT